MDEANFLQKDYDLKTKYLTDHLQRMWTRFNFFVTTESVLISGKFLFASNSPSVELTIAGIMLSLIWYVMGVQDRFLVDLYRTEVQKTGVQYALAALGENVGKVYNYVGRTDEDYVKDYRKEREAKHSQWGKARHWLDHVSPGGRNALAQHIWWHSYRCSLAPSGLCCL
jgi:hypothetical protein